MIFGKLSSPSTYTPLLYNGIWREAFDCLRALDSKSKLGITELRGRRMFVNVHTYETRSVADCRFEGHRKMIDVQYVIEGGERVDWELKDGLEELGPYDAERDFQFYKAPSVLSGTSVHLKAGFFGVFFQQDGHRPQIFDNEHQSVLKAVIKIDCGLFESA